MHGHQPRRARVPVLLAAVLVVVGGLAVGGVLASAAESDASPVLVSASRPGSAGEAAGLPLAGPTTPPPVPTSTTTTTVPPAGRQPTPDDPLRVVVTGDSVAFDLAGPLVWALDTGGRADAEFVLSPSIARDTAAQLLWQQRIDTTDPEVIVVLMGTWESYLAVGQAESEGLSLFDDDWPARYEADVLTPWMDLLTSGGAEVVWVGMPAAADWGRSVQFARLNQSYENLQPAWPELTFIDGAAVMAGPWGPFADIGTDAFGREVRWRNLDGLHLCADGAVRLAEAVLQHLAERWNVRAGPGWRQGDWRLQVGYPPEECPPPGT